LWAPIIQDVLDPWREGVVFVDPDDLLRSVDQNYPYADRREIGCKLFICHAQIEPMPEQLVFENVFEHSSSHKSSGCFWSGALKSSGQLITLAGSEYSDKETISLIRLRSSRKLSKSLFP